MSPELINLIIQATFESLYMVGIAAMLGTAFGLPLGVFLATSRKGELFAAPIVNRVLGIVVNATRSTPFIILVVAIIPFTPHCRHLDRIERRDRAADHCINAVHRAPGRSRDPRGRRWPDRDCVLVRGLAAQIVFKVLIPEALPGLLLALTLAVVSLLGYSAMVGAVGGGGLGDLGIRYGYQRFMPEMMLAVVVVLIALVQLVQSAGDYLARRVNRRLRHR